MSGDVGDAVAMVRLLASYGTVPDVAGRYAAAGADLAEWLQVVMDSQRYAGAVYVDRAGAERMLAAWVAAVGGDGT